MPRIGPVDWKTLVRVFELHGCQYKRKQGSHHILVCPGARRAVVIPEYDEIDVDIIKNNMRTAGMTREDHFDLLERVR
ncbi:MAG: addiction module toxin, HicA family [Armatimonadetes bacterium]|nr:addiction module toxin, HicA family [Armatimonadota bacterium]